MAKLGKEQREKFKMTPRHGWHPRRRLPACFAWRVSCPPFRPFTLLPSYPPVLPLPPSLAFSFSDSRHRQSRGGKWPAGSNAASALVKDGLAVVKARTLCGRRERPMFDAAGFLCGISALWCFGVEGIGCCEPPGRLG
jgi:hypothetical protein